MFSSIGLLCYSSGCLVVMDSLTSSNQWQLVGHPTEVSTISLQQDGRGLASASPAHVDWSCEVRVWSVESKKCIEVRFGLAKFCIVASIYAASFSKLCYWSKLFIDCSEFV